MGVYLIRVDVERKLVDVTREGGPGERFEPCGNRRTKLVGFDELRSLLHQALMRIAAGGVPRTPGSPEGP